jgi:hypothetical protein
MGQGQEDNGQRQSNAVNDAGTDAAPRERELN